mgnify:CR=1 FL=1
MSKITVLCVKFGTAYSTDYVVRLRNMVARHLTIPYEFVCLTDDATPIEGVRLIVQPSADYKRGWWYKVHMFDPNLAVEGTILYFDLDVVITDNIDKLVSKNGQFYGIRDFNRKFNKDYRCLNSSVMTWLHGDHSIIWEQFIKLPSEAMRTHGDQDWIWRITKSKIIFWPDSWVQSYKWEIRSRDDLAVVDGKRNFVSRVHNPIVSADCCVLVFHGEPKPHEVQDQFIIDNWI